jgi:hypothetical protein
MITGLVADDSFLAVESVFREFFQERLGDQRLGPDVDLELDVVRFRGVDAERLREAMPQHLAGGARRFHCCIKIVRHEV